MAGLSGGAATGAATGAASRPPVPRFRRSLGARLGEVRRRDGAVARRPPLVLLVPGLAVALLAAVPLVYLVLRAADAPAGVGPLLLRPRTIEILLTTVSLGAIVAVLSTLFGLPLAWLTARTDLPGRRLWTVLAAIPLAIPSYVTAFGFIAAFGPRGLLRTTLSPLGDLALPSIYGLAGTSLVLSLAAYPYVYLAARAAILRTDPSLEEAARSLGDGPRRAFWRVTLPAIGPALGAGIMLAVLYAISDFGAVALLGLDTLSRAIYTQYRAAFDRSLAAVLALLLVALALAVAALEASARRRSVRLTLPPRRPPTIHRLGRWRWPALALAAGIVGLAAFLPVATLAFWLLRGLANDEPFRITVAAAIGTLTASSGAAIAALLVAVPVGLLAVRHPGGLTNAVGTAVAVVFALPGIVVALAVVSLTVGLPIVYQTLPVLVLAYAIRFLPEALGPLRASLARAGVRPEEAARSLGDGPLLAFWRVTLPAIRPALVAGAALVFLTTAKELPMALILGPIGFETLATRIWGAASDGFYARAAAPGLLLVLVSALGTALVLRGEQGLGGSRSLDDTDAEALR
ncbi:MAG TPA: iron ABC transporter permease [Candidatus Binatia bacterium]|nr:iron ABC transporter permease [Candidatus Binatia bacterium]